nr:MAG TPA: hypothetical protein [Caudoviricetes sp.]
MDWSWMHPNPVNKQLESRNLFYFVYQSKAYYWWRDYSRLYACKRYRSEISIIHLINSCIISKRKGEYPR